MPPIKGWKKVTDLRYVSVNYPNHSVQITKKYLGLMEYEGWGVRELIGTRAYLLLPDPDVFQRNARLGGWYTALSKKDAIKFAKGWMRAHSYSKAGSRVR